MTSSLIDYFMKHVTEPVVSALRNQGSIKSESADLLKSKIDGFRDKLLEEINRAHCHSEVEKTLEDLVQKVVDQIENEVVDSSDSSDPSQESSPIEEILKIKKEEPTTPQNMSSFSADENSKGMPSRKRAKRSLEDTVQMLSKENSISPPPNFPAAQVPTLPFVLPPVPVAFSNMQRWLGFNNPVYLNAVFPPPKPSEEQLAALMKISMQAANFMKSVGPSQIPVPSDSDTEDIKIDVESDDGDIEVSPSPSTGDLTENEGSSSSSSGTGPMTSPLSGDGDNGVEKPFVCMHNNCGKRFANKFLLKKHMFIHTGLRPHTCPHCHKKFNRKDNLLRHKKTHTPSGPQLGQILPKVNFPGLPTLPSLHNMALTQGFSHFHALKMSLENGSPAVRGLS